MEKHPGPVVRRDVRYHLTDPCKLLPVETVEPLRLLLSAKHISQQGHTSGCIDQGLLPEIDKHDRHASPLKALNQRPVVGAGTMALQAEDGQVGPDGQHRFQTETVGRCMPHLGHLRQCGKAFQVLGITSRVGLFKIRQYASQAINRCIAVQNGQRRYIAALTQYHPVHGLGDGHLPVGQVRDGSRRLDHASLDQKNAAQQGGDKR